MKQYATNTAFEKMFLEKKVTQLEFGYLIDLDKNSVHDWLINKNQMRFNKLEQVAERIGKKVTIIIEDI